jgi:hypothetical protein
VENWLAVILASIIFTYALARVKIFIRLFYRRKAADDYVRLEVYLLRRLLAYNTTIPVVQIVKHHGLPWLRTEEKSGQDKIKTRPGREQRFAANTIDVYLNKPLKWRHMVREVNFLYHLYRRFSRRIQRAMRCEKFLWRTGFGCDDAAMTGILSGVLWVLKSEVFLLLKRRINFAARPTIRVQPIFDTVLLEVEFECIFTIRVGNVINAAWSLIHFPVKEVKGNG